MVALPSLRELCAELVRHPSMSSENAPHDLSNRAVVDTLANWLSDAGFGCEVLPVAGRPGKFNLIATLGRGPGGLVLSGHTDTVPYDEGRWRSDPFRLTERDGALYGLGICDMKGFLAMAVHVAAGFRDADLKQPLILVGTADEESTMAGVRALAAAGRPKARHALIGEPTGGRPVRLHKGIFMDLIRVRGKAGHSSRPDLGANAIEGMHEVLAELLAFRRELERRGHAPEFALPHPTLNLGCIHGGDSANRIPALCELQVDLRFPPGFELAQLRRELRERAAAALAAPGCAVECADLFDGIPAFSTAATAPIVQACETLTGHAAGAVDFATEGGFLNRMGMETVILGPGDIERAHQPDECLPLDRIEPMLATLRGLVQRFCL
ncbi:MAG: acetylornithine deacetylase [Gammaproteobacteria bacterium]|nr:acetylornithine deacetylase [Gammaproteobacteria bacterium]